VLTARPHHGHNDPWQMATCWHNNNNPSSMELNPIAEDVTVQEDDKAENPLRSFTLNLLVERKKPVESDKMGPKLVWKTCCDNMEFEGWEHGNDFQKLLVCCARKQS